MSLVIKTAPFTAFNVGLNDLHNNLNNVIARAKYKSNKNADLLDDDLTTYYKTSSVVSTETIPELSDITINNLYRVDTTIYNKDLRDDELALFKFVNPYFSEDIVYCYNYKNEDFKYCINKFNMFFCSNKPCLLMDIAPFTLAQYYMLLDNIGYRC